MMMKSKKIKLKHYGSKESIDIVKSLNLPPTSIVDFHNAYLLMERLSVDALLGEFVYDYDSVGFRNIILYLLKDNYTKEIYLDYQEEKRKEIDRFTFIT